MKEKTKRSSILRDTEVPIYDRTGRVLEQSAKKNKAPGKNTRYVEETLKREDPENAVFSGELSLKKPKEESPSETGGAGARADSYNAGRGKDYYKILGVSKYATTVMIREAYATLKQQPAPDEDSGKLEDQEYNDLREAFGVLIDNRRRALYDVDRYGRSRESPIYKQEDLKAGFSSSFQFDENYEEHMDKDYYDILRISKYATMAEIIKAYATLDQQAAADKDSGKPMDQKYSDVREAYSLLINNRSRALYDVHRFRKSTESATTDRDPTSHAYKQESLKAGFSSSSKFDESGGKETTTLRDEEVLSDEQTNGALKRRTSNGSDNDETGGPNKKLMITLKPKVESSVEVSSKDPGIPEGEGITDDALKSQNDKQEAPEAQSESSSEFEGSGGKETTTLRDEEVLSDEQTNGALKRRSSNGSNNDETGGRKEMTTLRDEEVLSEEQTNGALKGHTSDGSNNDETGGPYKKFMITLKPKVEWSVEVPSKDPGIPEGEGITDDAPKSQNDKQEAPEAQSESSIEFEESGSEKKNQDNDMLSSDEEMPLTTSLESAEEKLDRRCWDKREKNTQ